MHKVGLSDKLALHVSVNGGADNAGVVFSVAPGSGSFFSVDSSGVITPIATGMGAVLAKDGSGNLLAREAVVVITQAQATFEAAVTAGTTVVADAAGLRKAHKLVMGSTLPLSITVNGGTANAGLTFAASPGSSAFATVDGAGVITPVAPGLAVIDVTDVSGDLVVREEVYIISVAQANEDARVAAATDVVVKSQSFADFIDLNDVSPPTMATAPALSIVGGLWSLQLTSVAVDPQSGIHKNGDPALGNEVRMALYKNGLWQGENIYIPNTVGPANTFALAVVTGVGDSWFVEVKVWNGAGLQANFNSNTVIH